MAEKRKGDPTITTESLAEPAEGAHPALPVEEAADWAGSRKFADNPDKPDPSTVAQIEAD